MHLKSVDLDIVLVNNKTGEKVPAPLYMTYNHHHALLLGKTDGLMKLLRCSRVGCETQKLSTYPGLPNRYAPQVVQLFEGQGSS